jgi:hypothetical protein
VAFSSADSLGLVKTREDDGLNEEEGDIELDATIGTGATGNAVRS